MNFDEAYQRLREGTATDEEAAFVARELENVRKISAILDNPTLLSPEIGQAETDTVQKARKAFNKKTLIRTVAIVLCSLAAIAAIVARFFSFPPTFPPPASRKSRKHRLLRQRMPVWLNRWGRSVPAHSMWITLIGISGIRAAFLTQFMCTRSNLKTCTEVSMRLR